MVRLKDIDIFVESYYNKNGKILIFQFLFISMVFPMISSQIEIIFHKKIFWTILDQIFYLGPWTNGKESENFTFSSSFQNGIIHSCSSKDAKDIYGFCRSIFFCETPTYACSFVTFSEEAVHLRIEISQNCVHKLNDFKG